MAKLLDQFTQQFNRLANLRIESLSPQNKDGCSQHMPQNMITITNQVEISWFSFVNIINANRCGGKSKTRKQPELNSISKFLLKIDLYNQCLQAKANN